MRSNRIEWQATASCLCALLVCIPCSQAAGPERDGFPSSWWQPVSRDEVASWEILPQEAGPGEVIVSKRNELGLLSNLAATPFTYHGKRYASIEGFWQMLKYPEGANDSRAVFPGITWDITREEVSQLAGFEAKRAGKQANQNMKTMGITWVTFEGRRMERHPTEPGEHYSLIVDVTRAKVLQNPDVKRVLLATGNLILRPDHHQDSNGPAAEHYCDIMMKIRDELRSRIDDASDD